MKGMYFTNHCIGVDEYQVRVDGERLFLYKVSVPDDMDAEFIYETNNFNDMKAYIKELYAAYAESIF